MRKETGLNMYNDTIVVFEETVQLEVYVQSVIRMS